MPRIFSKIELFIFIAIIRQHLKVYLHENNQKADYSKPFEKKQKVAGTLLSIDSLHFSEKQLLKGTTLLVRGLIK